MKVLLIGGSGKIGKEIAKELKKSIYSVRVLARFPEKIFLQKDEAFEVVQGDVLNYNDVEKAMEGIDVVISCVGPSSTEDSKNMICTNATKNILKTHPSRYIVFTGAIVDMEGDEKKSLGSKMFGAYFKKSKGKILADREAERDILLSSIGCDWTLVRMPHLVEEEEGTVEASDRKLPSMKVFTGPLAEWTVKHLVEENRFIKKGVFVGSTPIKK